MDQTKITAKIYSNLLEHFDKEIAGAHLKRDAFLNAVINHEVQYLEQDLKGIKLSNAARKHISGSLKRLGTKTVNIKVHKHTADELNRVVRNTNIVRDAFLNRLIYLLLATPKLLTALKLPSYIEHPSLSSAQGMPVGPLSALSEVLGDPLFYLRIAHERIHGVGLYASQDPISRDLEGFCCNISNHLVPGTDEYKNPITADML